MQICKYLDDSRTQGAIQSFVQITRDSFIGREGRVREARLQRRRPVMSVKWFRVIAGNIVSMLTPPIDTVVTFVLPPSQR